MQIYLPIPLLTKEGEPESKRDFSTKRLFNYEMIDKEVRQNESIGFSGHERRSG